MHMIYILAGKKKILEVRVCTLAYVYKRASSCVCVCVFACVALHSIVFYVD